jgi:hypothetical protein
MRFPVLLSLLVLAATLDGAAAARNSTLGRISAT